MELDSSTAAKFSRHLLIRMPGAAFASNFHAGAFVKSLLGAEPHADSQAPAEPEQQLAEGEPSDGIGVAAAAGPDGSAGGLGNAAGAGPVSAAEAAAAALSAQGGSVCAQRANAGSGSGSEAQYAGACRGRPSQDPEYRAQTAQCSPGPDGPSPDRTACGSAGLLDAHGSTGPGTGTPGAVLAGALQKVGSAGACQDGAAHTGADALGGSVAGAASARPGQKYGAAACEVGEVDPGMGDIGSDAIDPHPSQQEGPGRCMDGGCGLGAAADAPQREQLLVTKVGSCHRLVLRGAQCQWLLALYR